MFRNAGDNQWQPVVTNVLWLILDRVVRAFVGFVTVVLLARYLGPEQFGKYNFALSILSITGVIAGLGLKDAVVRRLVISDDDPSRLVNNAVALRLVSGVVGVAFVLCLIHLLRPSDHTSIIVVSVMSGILVFQAGEIVRFWFESRVLSRHVVVIDSVNLCAFMLIKITMILAGMPLIYFAAILLLEAAVQCASLFVVFRKKSGLPVRFQFDASYLSRLVGDSTPLLLAGILIIATIHVDKIIIGSLLGDNQVGVYSVASQLFLFVMSLIVTIEVSLYPRFVKELSNTSKILNDIGRLYRYVNVAQFALFLVSLVCSEWLIARLYGDAYRGAASVFNVYMFSSLIVSFARAYDQYFKVVKEFRRLMVRQFAILLTNVILIIALIPHFGILAAAIAATISYSVVILGTTIIGGQRSQLRLLYRRVLGF